MCSKTIKNREIPSLLYNMFYCDCLFDILKTIKCLSEQENFIDLQNNNYKKEDLQDISIEYILKNIQIYLNKIQTIIKINNRDLTNEEYDYFFTKYLFNQYYFFISRYTENSNNKMYENLENYLKKQKVKVTTI